MKLWQKEGTLTAAKTEQFTVGRDREFDFVCDRQSFTADEPPLGGDDPGRIDQLPLLAGRQPWKDRDVPREVPPPLVR